MKKMSTGEVFQQEGQGGDRTVSLIETLYAKREKNSLILNPDYLDDERLPEEQRTAVLKEIFNRSIREPQWRGSLNT